ncbi:hypothetical protein DFJ74DRAFT_680116 [Hyaloraphidium curvatum]|nr:hypothetical protein DFJ74DRAFT_680116 [Hyaloraphidium curvatum]
MSLRQSAAFLAFPLVVGSLLVFGTTMYGSPGAIVRVNGYKEPIAFGEAALSGDPAVTEDLALPEWRDALALDPLLEPALRGASDPDAALDRKPFCTGGPGAATYQTDACGIMRAGSRRLKAWRDRVWNERAAYAKRKHPRCPKSPSDPLRIGYVHGRPWWRGTGLENFTGCPVPCAFRFIEDPEDEGVDLVMDDDFGIWGGNRSNLSSKDGRIRALYMSETHSPGGMDDGVLESTDILASYDRVSDVVFLDSFVCPSGLSCLRPAPAAEELHRGKRKFAASFVSKCGAGSRESQGVIRRELMLDLDRELAIISNATGRPRLEVDHYGKCLYSPDLDMLAMANASKVRGGPAGEKLFLSTRYKFVLAFENSVRRDYLTEKPFDALRAGAVPVYYGSPSARDFLPPGSYVDVLDFRSAKELAAHLAALDADDDAFLAHFAWRATDYKPRTPLGFSLMERGERNFLCRTCGVALKVYCRAEGT